MLTQRKELFAEYFYFRMRYKKIRQNKEINTEIRPAERDRIFLYFFLLVA